MLTGLHAGSYGRFQLGSGLFLTGLDPDSAPDAKTLRAHIADAVADGSGVLGVTRGGGSFRCVPWLRSLGDGAGRTPVRGGVINDGWTVMMTGTLLELTPGNAARMLAMSVTERRGGVTVVTARNDTEVTDYEPRLCWVGSLVSGLVLIELSNVLNMNGASFTFGEQSEGALAFEFRAHAEDDGGEAPFRMLFFEEENE